MIELNYEERIELSYLRLKGFKYLTRNEIGSVNVFVNKPHRDKDVNYYPFGKDRGGYDHWIETKTPVSIEEQRRTRPVELGKYEFIEWKDEPMVIDELINGYETKWAEIYFKEMQIYKGMYEEKRKENERLKGVIEWENSYEKRCLVVEKENEKIKDQLNRIKVLVIECDADNRAPQPYEILDIVNE